MQIDHIKHLIFREIFGQATEGEKARLKTWLDESEANRELYEKMRSAEFLEMAITDDNSAASEKVWEGVERGASVPRRRPLRIRVMRVAAILAIPLIAGITALLLDLRGDSDSVAAAEIRPGGAKVIVMLPSGEQLLLGDQDNISVLADGVTFIENKGDTVIMRAEGAEFPERQLTTYRTPRGGEYAIKLEDGTIVTMNSDSELRAPVKFGKDQRTIYFSGEGYFEVSHDPGRPFVVKAPQADIEVLGTEFNLRSYDDEDATVTTLIQGAVEVTSAGGEVWLKPGMQSTVTRDGEMTTAQVATYPFVAWKSGRIVFENARVEDIMKVLRRWYNCDVYYGDDAVKERRFTMDLLKYDDITQILELMAKVNVRYEINAGAVHISSE